MRLTTTTTVEVPDGATLTAHIDGKEEDLVPVRYASGGVWLLDHRGEDADGWTFYRRGVTR